MKLKSPTKQYKNTTFIKKRFKTLKILRIDCFITNFYFFLKKNTSTIFFLFKLDLFFYLSYCFNLIGFSLTKFSLLYK